MQRKKKKTKKTKKSKKGEEEETRFVRRVVTTLVEVLGAGFEVGHGAGAVWVGTVEGYPSGKLTGR